MVCDLFIHKIERVRSLFIQFVVKSLRRRNQIWKFLVGVYLCRNGKHDHQSCGQEKAESKTL